MKTIKNLFVFLGLFILDILYIKIILGILSYLGLSITEFSKINKSLLLIAIEISFMVILYFIYKKDLNSEFTSFIKNINKNLKLGFKCWIIGLGIMLISNIIINQICGSAADNNVEIQKQFMQLPIYVIFSACIFAPFCEEIIFRKALRNIIKNDTIFIIVSGLIFGFIHVASSQDIKQILYIIPYGTFGIVFGYMYVKTKSIFTSITFHMIHNTFLMIVSAFALGVI